MKSPQELENVKPLFYAGCKIIRVNRNKVKRKNVFKSKPSKPSKTLNNEYMIIIFKYVYINDSLSIERYDLFAS